MPFGELAPGARDAGELRASARALPLEAVARGWEDRLGRVRIRLGGGGDCVDALRTATAHILVNRDGPALQPGPRRYTRSWIRDGATMAAALLRMGCFAEVRDFLRWYAVHQAADGNVPCAVDRSGPDWLPEHDSHGQLAFTLGGVLPDHRRSRARRRAVARRAARDGLSRAAARAAPGSGVPPARTPGVLRTVAGVGEPRGLPGASRARLLGRLLGAARPGRRGAPRRRRSASPRSRSACARFATPAASACTRRSRRPSRIAGSRTSRAPSSGRTSIRPRRPRPSPRRTPRGACRRRRSPTPTTSTSRVSAGAGAARSIGTTTARTRSASSARSCASDAARTRTSCSTSSSPIDARSSGTSGPKSPGAIPAAPAISATCHTPGSARSTCSPCSACSPSNRRETIRSCWPRACPRRGSTVTASRWLDFPPGGARSATACGATVAAALRLDLAPGLRAPPGGIVVRPPLARPLAAVEGEGVASFDRCSATLREAPARIRLRF